MCDLCGGGVEVGVGVEVFICIFVFYFSSFSMCDSTISVEEGLELE